ncbi:serine/threonine-protein kinase SBK1-like [Ambystoma mexicanum]|uniref:serine/threonine-protein kinase SBK1-like n=1 Tax=Ambystoma mexicanum TaxID=8296 RepID=UPI0037E940B1
MLKEKYHEYACITQDSQKENEILQDEVQTKKDRLVAQSSVFEASQASVSDLKVQLSEYKREIRTERSKCERSSNKIEKYKQALEHPDHSGYETGPYDKGEMQLPSINSCQLPTNSQVQTATDPFQCEEKNCTMNSSATETEFILQDQVSQMSRDLVEVVLEDYFEVLEALGAGAYGSVLRVQNRATDQTMALKLLKKSRTSLSGFLVEYCTAFRLSSHPSIIGCYEIAFQTTEHYVFAQELSPVGDLFSLIEDQVGIPEEKVKRCAVQISSALDFMHKKGYVHRDIKPENVLLMDRECHRIKVTDFGFTRLKGTAISARSGTISYMSPELYQPDAGCLEAEASLDVWAFGVLLFCVLTGTFPWEMAALSDINYSAFVEWITGGVDAIPSCWNRFTVEALKMFSKLLAHSPTQRSRAVEVLHLIDLPWTVDLYLTDGIEEINSTEEEYSTEPSASDSMSSCSDGSQAESSSPSSTSSTSCSHSESHEEAGSNKSIIASFLMSSSGGLILPQKEHVWMVLRC